MAGKKLIAVSEDLHWKIKAGAALAHDNIQRYTEKLLSKALETPHNEVEHGNDCKTDQ